eukprot:Amastigsp_a4568_32.p1 type:complete len:155 gc:universal Amastigsp_a4568_32:574-110(-)
MATVNILNVTVLDNPTAFTNPFQFEICFECLGPLAEDLEWRLVYVGSAESEEYDQQLDQIFVGPIPVGVNKFVFQANAPDASRIPKADLLGVTVVLLSCWYRGVEFFRVGYFVNNSPMNSELPEDFPVEDIPLEQIERNILAEKPRVTTFNVEW